MGQNVLIRLFSKSFFFQVSPVFQKYSLGLIFQAGLHVCMRTHVCTHTHTFFKKLGIECRVLNKPVKCSATELLSQQPSLIKLPSEFTAAGSDFELALASQEAGLKGPPGLALFLPMGCVEHIFLRLNLIISFCMFTDILLANVWNS